MRRWFSWLQWETLFFWWFPYRLNRDAEELRFLMLIRTAISHDVPVENLSDSLSSNVAEEWKGMYSRLILELQSGRPLHEILVPTSTDLPLANPREKYVDPANLVSPETQAWLTVGHEVGILMPLIDHQIQQLQQEQIRLHSSNRMEMICVVAIITTMAFVITFFLIFTMPALAEIMRDFGVNISNTVFIKFITVCDFLVLYGIVTIPITLLLIYVTTSLASLTGENPLQRWLFPLRGRPTLLCALGLSTQSGRNPLMVAESTSLYHNSKPLRRKSSRLKQQLSDGHSLSESLRTSGLVNRAQATWIEKAEQSSRLGDVLNTLGLRAANREAAFWNFLNRSFSFFTIIVIACIALWFGYAVFEVLTLTMMNIH